MVEKNLSKRSLGWGQGKQSQKMQSVPKYLPPLTPAENPYRNLRSGRDCFDSTFDSMKGDWPTIQQAQALAIKTTNLVDFVKHNKWILSKMGDCRSSRLSVMVLVESIYLCPELKSKICLLIKMARDKLMEVKYDERPPFLEAYIKKLNWYMLVG